MFAFLSDLRNHWRLEERFVDLEHADAKSGRVRMKGPFGISRTAETRVIDAVPPNPVGELRGTARIGRRTHGHVRWQIEPDAMGSRVALEALPDSLASVDRAILALGGRRWMRRLLAAAVRRLDDAIPD